MAQKLPRIISQEEFEKLFDATLKKKKKQYAVAMLLGFEAGMRISEIVGYEKGGTIVVPKLTKENIDMTQNTIRIISGKGNKDRIVPLPKRFNQAAYSLFPLSISRRALQNWVTQLGRKILGRTISFHTFRHGFGSYLAGHNRPLHEIQMLMGHSRLDTTGIYLHANPKAALEGAREVF